MKLLLPFLLIWLLSGCTLKTGHERFIDSMNLVIGYKDFSKYRNKFYKLADYRLTEITKKPNGYSVYHYESYKRTSFCLCQYSVTVDKDGTMKSWDFEPHSNKQCCKNLG